MAAAHYCQQRALCECLLIMDNIAPITSSFVPRVGTNFHYSNAPWSPQLQPLQGPSHNASLFVSLHQRLVPFLYFVLDRNIGSDECSFKCSICNGLRRFRNQISSGLCIYGLILHPETMFLLLIDTHTYIPISMIIWYWWNLLIGKIIIHILQLTFKRYGIWKVSG